MCEQNCNNCEHCATTETSSGTQATQLEFFDGWDEGTLHGADTYSKKYNSIYESWEQTAFRTRNT